MTYLRITQPFLAYKLLPWAVPNCRQSAQEIVVELCERLKEKPDETFCLIAIEGKLIKAFIAAYKQEGDVIAWQARVEAGFNRQQEFIGQLVKWSKEIGAKRIIAKVLNEQIARYYTRRYGFSKLSSNNDYVEMAKAV